MHKDRVLHKRLGKLLLERGTINEEQLNKALELQKKQQEQGSRWKLIGEILIELGYASEEEVINSVTTQYAVPFLHIEGYEIDEEYVKIGLRRMQIESEYNGCVLLKERRSFEHAVDANAKYAVLSV